MHSGFKLSLFFAFFIAISVTYARPAAAICDTCVVNQLGQVILGVPSGPAMGPFKRMVPGETKGADEEDLPGNAMPTSLVEYYEKVWWPRMIELTKAQQGAADKTATLLNESAARTQQAQAYGGFQQRQDQRKVENASKTLGRADLLCPEQSMGRSSLALQASAIFRFRDNVKRSAREMAGDKNLPPYAGGKITYDEAVHRWRVENQTCLKDGSNGTASKFCANTKPELVNADEAISTLTGSFVYDDATDALSPNHTSIVKRFIDNVFANRVFEPLPTYLTQANPLDKNVIQITADQAAYGAAMTTFQGPFLQEQADREPEENVEALGSLEAELDRAGYTGIAKELFIKDGKVSRAAEEYIRFKVYQTDTQTIANEIASLGGMSMENLMQASIQKQMMEMTLLYDIREQIKQSNLILGAIGAVLSEPQYRSIRDRINAVTGER